MNSSKLPQHSVEFALDQLIQSQREQKGVVGELLPYRAKIQEAQKAGLSSTKIASAIKQALGDKYALSSIRKAIPLIAGRTAKSCPKTPAIRSRVQECNSAHNPNLPTPAPITDQAAPSRTANSLTRTAAPTPADQGLGLFADIRLESDATPVRRMTDDR